MPINFDLEFYRKIFKCTIYFETGLWDARYDVSSKKALQCKFDKVFCIELRKDFVEVGREVFKDEISKGRYCLINDDSINIGKYLDNDLIKSNKCIFFLDAHVDNSNISNYKLKCPL